MNPPVLVCAPASSPRVPRGSIFTHSCSKCKERVMVAPSGQQILRTHKDCVIVCGNCYVPDGPALPAFSLEDFLDEVANATPNFWRKRN